MGSKLIKVKVAVTVDSEGHWQCCGWGDANGLAAEALKLLNDTVDTLVANKEVRYWIAIEVPVPGEGPTIEGYLDWY